MSLALAIMHVAATTKDSDVLVRKGPISTGEQPAVAAAPCGFCAQGIEKTFRKNPATEDVFVSLEHRLVAIATRQGADLSDDELRKALKDAGYDVKAINRTERSLAELREQAKAKP